MARPQGKGEGEDHGTIVRCLVENWGQETKIQECRDCFGSIGEDVLSETNLPIAKQCTQDYLPMQYAACESEIAALNTGDEEQGMQVLGCMGEAMHMNGLNYCLNTTSPDAAAVDRLTDASMCIGEGHKYIMKYVRNTTMAGAGKRKQRKMERQGQMMKFQMVRLFTKAHCDLATQGDATKDRDCTRCFMTAMRSFKESKDEAALLSESTQCSTEHLGELYSECTTLLQTEPKGAHQCFMRVLTKAQVEECADADAVVNAETLAEVMECTKEKAAAWVKENAKGKVAKKFLEMLGDGEDVEDEEELE